MPLESDGYGAAYLASPFRPKLVRILDVMNIDWELHSRDATSDVYSHGVWNDGCKCWHDRTNRHSVLCVNVWHDCHMRCNLRMSAYRLDLIPRGRFDFMVFDPLDRTYRHSSHLQVCISSRFHASNEPVA